MREGIHVGCSHLKRRLEQGRVGDGEFREWLRFVRTVSAQLSWSHFVVDLKRGKFRSEDVGQMNKYLLV